jgi:hypothetical protein
MQGMKWPVWNAFPFRYSVSFNGHHVHALHNNTGYHKSIAELKASTEAN